MSEKFDPYYTWLGIPSEEQPADHYRLLGLRAFEMNADVISNAADQRMAHLKTLQTGKNAAASQTLLTEVAAASACLLVAEKKAAYDANLRKQLEAKVALKTKPLPQAAPLPVATLPAARPLPQPVAPAPQPVFVATPAISNKSTAKAAVKKSNNLPLIVGGVCALVALLGGLIVLLSQPGSQPTVARTSPPGNGEAGPPVDTVRPRPMESAKVDLPPMPTETVVPPTTPSPLETIPAPEVPTATTPPSVAPEVTTSPTTVTPPANVTPPSTNSEQPLPPNPKPFGAPLEFAKQAEPAETANDANGVDVPDERSLTAARTQILEVFGKDAKAATKPELKVELADKMDKLANDTPDDPAVRYVLLDNARKLYIGAGEVERAMTAAQNLTQWYQFGQKAKFDLHIASYQALSEATLTSEQRELLAQRLRGDLEAAIRNQQIEFADPVSLLYVKVAGRLKDGEEKRLAGQQRTAVIKLKAEVAEFEKAQAALATDAKDTAANLVVGKFLCGVQGDWKTGRAHLVKGGIGALEAVVAADAAADEGNAGEATLAAADEWFAWADNAKGIDAELVALAKARAKHWYRASVDSLTGLGRAKVDKRLEELASITDLDAPRDPPASTAKTTPAKSGTPAKPSTPTKTASSRNSKDQGWESGLLGRLFIDNQVQNVLLSYQEGYTISNADVSQMLIGRIAGQRVKVELEGVLLVPKDGDYTFNVAGGSASGGVHAFHVAGRKLTEVGDDRSKNDFKTITLPKGEYPVKFELTGGELGTAKIAISLGTTMEPGSPLPTFGTPKKLAAALRQAVKKEIAFGTVASPAPTQNPAVPNSQLLVPVTPPSTTAKGKPLPLNKWVDSFPLVDFDQDLERGYWNPGPDNSIQVDSEICARLRMPVVLTNCSYDLAVEIKLGDDHDSVDLIIPVGDKNVMVVVDGYGGGKVSYFDKIGGKDAPQQPQAVRGNLLVRNQAHRLEVSVRLKGDRAHLEFSVDGNKQFEHDCAIAECEVTANWAIGTRAQPALATYLTGLNYTSCQVRPVSGEAFLGRDAPLLETIPAKVLAMKSMPLTSLKHIDLTHHDNNFGISRGTRNPIIGGKECTDYLFVHAPSRITYAIPPEAKYFTAIAYCAMSSQVNFIVKVDGKELFSHANRPITPVVVELPAKGKVLELECDSLGDVNRDHSSWCYPMFRQ